MKDEIYALHIGGGVRLPVPIRQPEADRLAAHSGSWPHQELPGQNGTERAGPGGAALCSDCWAPMERERAPPSNVSWVPGGRIPVPLEGQVLCGRQGDQVKPIRDVTGVVRSHLYALHIGGGVRLPVPIRQPYIELRAIKRRRSV